MTMRGPKITADHWRVLISLYHIGGWGSIGAVAYSARISSEHAAHLLRDLSRPRFCGEPSAWVTLSRRGSAMISGRRGVGCEECTGGFRALEDARGRPELAPMLEAQWRQEALSGMRSDGQETGIKNAVAWRGV